MEELLVGDNHARRVQGRPDREHSHALQQVTAKFNRAKRFSVVNRGARTSLKHRGSRSSCNARHSVERDMSSELCRRSSLRVCRCVSVTATPISANTSVARRRFSRRDSSGAPRRRCLIFVLMLSSQSGRIARISRGFRFSWSHWRRSQRHDPWVQKLQTRERSKEEVKNCLSTHHHPSSSIVVMASSRARNAPGRVHLTTSQQWPE